MGLTTVQRYCAACDLERFNTCCKGSEETFVAFASKLKGLLDYYLNSRYVTDFAQLCELLVCDRIKSTLTNNCLQYVLSIESGTKNGWMSVGELTSSIDRYQSSHSVVGDPRPFAIGQAPVRPVRPQLYGGSAPVRPAQSVRPPAPRFNQGTSGVGRGLPPRANSGQTFAPRKRCFECGSSNHLLLTAHS